MAKREKMSPVYMLMSELRGMKVRERARRYTQEADKEMKGGKRRVEYRF